jgi:hypothetical protein
MKAISKIERVISSGLLRPNLLAIPNGGASLDQIALEESAMSRLLSPIHKGLLRRWNGLNLEVIRVFGCEVTLPSIPSLRESQFPPSFLPAASLAFASDPVGFVYVELEAGGIVSVDSDGGEIELVASSIDDFFDNFVFGMRGDKFADSDWLQELRNASLID